jgi:hypothetical protein
MDLGDGPAGRFSRTTPQAGIHVEPVFPLAVFCVFGADVSVILRPDISSSVFHGVAAFEYPWLTHRR